MSFSQRKSIRLSRDAYARGNAYSITISTFMRYPWFKRHPELAASAMERLNATADERGTHLFAWCIMPDHMHLLLKDDNVVNFVRIFKGRLTPVARNLNSERSLWQRSFYDHALRKEESLNEIAIYIWMNPVRAGIVEKAKDYPWSGSGVWPDWREFC